MKDDRLKRIYDMQQIRVDRGLMMIGFLLGDDRYMSTKINKQRQKMNMNEKDWWWIVLYLPESTPGQRWQMLDDR